MRPLRIAFTLALAALALPAVAFAQTPMAVPLNPGWPPYIQPPDTPKPGHPFPPAHWRPGHRPPGHWRPGYRPGYTTGQYPVIIDGSVVNRYLVTPGPAPTPKPKHTRRHNGEDQFETYSSIDANE